MEIKDLKPLFTEPYTRSQEIDETFDKIRVEQGSQAAIDYLIKIGATKLDFKSYIVAHHLDQYTKNNLPYEKRIELLQSLVDGEEIKNINIEYNKEKNRTEITLDTCEGIMHAIKFTEVCPAFLEVFPELETDGRIGECFRLAYEIMRNLNNSCQIVTGYIFGYTELSKFLHSWVEVKFQGKTYVIDGTTNLLINKEAYYTLKHAIPITKISQKTFKSDIKKHLDTLEGIELPMYLLYRNELIAGKELTKDKFEVETSFQKR